MSRIRCANGGGSSSVLSIRLADWSFIVSARSMTNTRRRDSNGVRVAAATTGSSMSETSISRRAAGRHPGEVGVGAGHARARRRACRVGGAVGQQRGGQLAGDLALAAARRPVEQVGVVGVAVGRQRRGQHGAGVGVVLEAGQQAACRRGAAGAAPASGVADGEPDGGDDHAAHRHLDQRGAQRDAQEALAHPGDRDAARRRRSRRRSPARWRRRR